MTVISLIEYGSTNYHLDTPQSDHDYKIVVTPNFDELYMKKDLNGAALPYPYKDKEHYSCMDVRGFAANLAKGNPNAIEMLFSTNIKFNENIDSMPIADLMYSWTIPYKEGYIASQWNYFIEAVGGIMYNSFKRYGVTPKTASRAIYFMNLVEHIATNNFKIDNTILRAPEVWKFAREVREEKVPISTNVDDYMPTYHDMVDNIVVPKMEFDSDNLFIKPTKEFVRKYL